MSSSVQRLELKDYEPFQRIEWRLQRLGWVVWGCVVGCALLGLLGPGWLSSTSAAASDQSLTIKYERFPRNHAPTLLRLLLQPETRGTRDLQLKVSRSLLDRVRIHRIEPEPHSQELAADGILYTFQRFGSSSSEIQVHLEFERFGRCQGRIGVSGREAVTIFQFVYP